MTPAFSEYVAPARRYPQIWRILAGLLLLVALYGGWLLLLGLLLGRVEPALGGAGQHPLERVRAGQEPGAMLMLFASFGGMALAVLVVVRVLHGRGLASLMGPRRRVGRDFVLAALVTFAGGGVLIAFLARHFAMLPGLEPVHWLFVLPMALSGIALQTLAEELVFRGWLMQQLAARFVRPLVWLGGPAVVFAALHYNPVGAGANAFAIVAAVAVLALAMGDLTRRTGSLGAAWGMHFANNCLALLVLATGPEMSGLALWRTPWGTAEPALFHILIADITVAVLAWALLVRLLGRDRPA